MNFLKTLIAVLLLTGSHGAAEAALRYELKNPFRFYKFESDYAVQRIAADLSLTATDRTISIEKIEHKLNTRQHWTHEITAQERAKWPTSWAGDTPLAIIEKLRKDEGRKPIRELVKADNGRDYRSALDVFSHFGWASLIDTHLSPDKSAVCWNRARRKHDNCTDYAAPKSWTVRIFDEGNVTGTCTWSASNGAKFRNLTASGQGPCKEVYLDVMAASQGGSISGKTSVTRTGAADVPALEVSFQDQLVVSFGDSFASGEGNPDRPVVLSYTKRDGADVLPRRPPATGIRGEEDIWAAHWIDRACHRSAYSWPVRASLLQALVKPTVPVTLLAYACSGAEVVEGYLFPFGGVEPSRARPRDRAQIAALYEDLCVNQPTTIASGAIPEEEKDDYLDELDQGSPFPWRTRERDFTGAITRTLKCTGRGTTGFARNANALMLSVGGNDLGFSRWIVAAITETGNLGFIPRLTECGGDHAEACLLTRARINRLDVRYNVLKSVLKNRVLPDLGLSAGKVLVASYPNAVYGSPATAGADPDVCPNGNGGMTASVWTGGAFPSELQIRNNKELKIIETFRSEKLLRLGKEFADEQPAFKVVDSFVKRFAGRGFCATGNPEEKTGSFYDKRDLREVDRLTDRPATETLHVPLSVGAGPGMSWRPFDPPAWRPYAARTRLLRTPNDVFVTVNNKNRNTLDDSPVGILDATGRLGSGAFHPTAEAHSVMADSFGSALATALAD